MSALEDDSATTPQTWHFPHPLDHDAEEIYDSAITYKEQYLREFSARIREKPDWTQKILDKNLMQKWILEAREQASTQHDIVIWNGNDVAFTVKELETCYKPFVELQGEHGIHPAIDCVWRTDALITENLRERLINAISTLENVSEEKKDWHPGSNKQVLDLVHPSLYPVVYDRTLNLHTGEKCVPPHVENSQEGDYSKRFAWLASDFDVSDDGTTAIKSYVNNLSTTDQKTLFYPILEQIFTAFVPLFNHCLSDLGAESYRRRRTIESGRYDHDSEAWNMLEDDEYDAMDAKIWEQYFNDKDITADFMHCKFKGIEEEDDPTEVKSKYLEIEEDPDEFVDIADFKNEWEGWKFYNLGNDPHVTWQPPELRPEFCLNGKKCKVIVKLANILLSPENPVYSGGQWHVESMLNERIVATGIYYLAQDNITESKLSFRHLTPNLETSYYLPQDSNFTTLYNIDREGENVQEIGDILTKDNRAIVFPNIFQHQVQRFELVDKTKPGFRKILVFFLCDPTEESVISSSSVAPQQAEHLEEIVQILRNSRLGQKLPEDVFQLILEELPSGMTREEAETYRQELMNERVVHTSNSEKVNGVHYSLCEH